MFFHLAPISYCFLFTFRNGISLSENVAHFSFTIPIQNKTVYKAALVTDQWAEEENLEKQLCDGLTDRPTDQPIDQPTDQPTD